MKVKCVWDTRRCIMRQISTNQEVIILITKSTCIIAHAVGKKAKRLAKMSPTVRLSRVNIKHRATMAPINRNNFRRRNINWKSALNFFLPMDTICSFRCHQLLKSLSNTCRKNGFIWNELYDHQILTFKITMTATITSQDRA